MTLKIVLVIIVILIFIAVLAPLFLGFFGVRIFQFGSVGVGTGAGAEIMRSGDFGERWEQSTLSEERGTPFPREILNLTFHPTDPDVIFLGTKSAGLWRSDTKGVSWRPIRDSARVLDPRADVFKVAVSAKDPRIMYLAVFQNERGRVLRSDDSGKSFREIFFTTEKRFGVFDVFIDPQNPERVLAVTGQGGLMETQDGGKTWRVKRWFGEALSRLFVNPNNTNEMYVLTLRNKIFKSTDGGKTWLNLRVRVVEAARQATSQDPTAVTFPEVDLNPFAVFSELSGGGIRAFIIDPNNFSTLYVIVADGVLRSKNGGVSWERLNVLIPPAALPVTSLAIHPRNPDITFVSAANQLHRTDDSGENWTVDILPTDLRIQSLYIHPKRAEVMFAILGR